MEVQINEIASTVRAVDGESLLSPTVMRRILRSVMQAIEERDRHAERVRAEQRLTGGVAEELEERE